ncbi:MAG: hypothetical protein GXZ08_03555 [Tissierellia bacterium]|nr:hypothetical protein [Tissierellia bacterium]
MYNCVDAEGGLENQCLTAVMNMNSLLDFTREFLLSMFDFKSSDFKLLLFF